MYFDIQSISACRLCKLSKINIHFLVHTERRFTFVWDKSGAMTRILMNLYAWIHFLQHLLRCSRDGGPSFGTYILLYIIAIKNALTKSNIYYSTNISIITSHFYITVSEACILLYNYKNDSYNFLKYVSLKLYYSDNLN